MKRKTWDEGEARALLAAGKTDEEIAGSVGATLGAIRGWRGRNRLRGNFRPQAGKGVADDGAQAGTPGQEAALPGGPVKLSLTLEGCRLSLSAPSLAAAARGAADLRRVLAGLVARTEGDGV